MPLCGPRHMATVTAMDHSDAVKAVFEKGWNEQDFESIDGVLANEFEFHIGGTTRVMSVDELREIVATWHLGFSDFRFETHAIVSAEDRAAAHTTLVGTHDGPWGGLDATGRSVSIEHMFFFRFEDGRIVEVWELLDRSEIRRQLTAD